jgi:hypothetical protein
MALRETQKHFDALDLRKNSFYPSVDDGVNILNLNINEAVTDNSLKHIASTFDYENHCLREGFQDGGRPIITFSNILNHSVFPLADILKEILEIGQSEMGKPVEIEFAVNIHRPKGKPKIFNLLQIRPIVENFETIDVPLEDISWKDTIIYANTALGNGIMNDITDFVYVKPEAFNPAKNLETAQRVGKLNDDFLKWKRNYVLVGPGRWGSNDPWLGIPVKWPQISAARVIVESGLKHYRIDPSQGYFTINPFIHDGFYDLEYLSKFTPFFEDDVLRHIRFDQPLKIMIDGKKSKGVIMKL